MVITMTKNCPNCGEIIEKDSVFCDNCGANVENVPINPELPFTEKNKLPLIFIGIAAVIVLLFLAISPSAIPNGAVFNLEGEPAQNVDVDGIYLRIPNEFTFDPSSININADNGIMSSTEGWSHEREYIGLMVMRLPYNQYNIDYSQILGANGGVQKNLYGYDGYYIELEDENGYAFSFIKNDKICVILVSSYYLFDKIQVV